MQQYVQRYSEATGKQLDPSALSAVKK